MTELHLVPRVPSEAIVTGTDRGDHRERLIHETLVDQVGGDLILDAAPDLVGVHEREPRSTTAGPAAQHQPCLVPEREGPLHVVMRRQRRAEVMTEHGRHRGADMVRRQQVAQSHQVRE